MTLINLTESQVTALIIQTCINTAFADKSSFQFAMEFERLALIEQSKPFQSHGLGRFSAKARHVAGNN